MTWGGVLQVLVTGIPALLVAILGIIGILITQRRADQRELTRSVTEASQEAARQRRDRRIEAYLDFMAAIRSVSRVARDVLEDGADAGSLTAEEIAPVDKSYSRVLLLGSAEVRIVAEKLIEGFFSWTGEFTDESWKALDTLEDEFLAAARIELDRTSQ